MAGLAKKVAQVLFNTPIYAEITAPKPPGRPERPTWAEVNDFCRGLRGEGMDVRAIVTKIVRFTSGMVNEYETAQPKNWGIVIDLNNSLGPIDVVYFPIKVMWVKDGSISEHWPEDLAMIHESLAQFEVGNIVKEQLDGR